MTVKAPLTGDNGGTLHFLYVHILRNSINYGIHKRHAHLDERPHFFVFSSLVHLNSNL